MDLTHIYDGDTSTRIFVSFRDSSTSAANSITRRLAEESGGRTTIEMWNPDDLWPVPVFEVAQAILRSNVLIRLVEPEASSAWMIAETKFAHRCGIPVLQIVSDDNERPSYADIVRLASECRLGVGQTRNISVALMMSAALPQFAETWRARLRLFIELFMVEVDLQGTSLERATVFAYHDLVVWRIDHTHRILARSLSVRQRFTQSFGQKNICFLAMHCCITALRNLRVWSSPKLDDSSSLSRALRHPVNRRLHTLGLLADDTTAAFLLDELDPWRAVVRSEPENLAAVSKGDFDRKLAMVDFQIERCRESDLDAFLHYSMTKALILVQSSDGREESVCIAQSTLTHAINELGWTHVRSIWCRLARLFVWEVVEPGTFPSEQVRAVLTDCEGREISSQSQLLADHFARRYG